MHKILKIAAAVIAGAAVLTFAGPLAGEAIATLPPLFLATAPDPLGRFGLPFEDVRFSTEDGVSLEGWFIAAEEPSAPAVVYAPATGHDQRSGLSLAPAFHQAGYHVLLFSYRGYARSDGPRGQFTYGYAESKDVDAAVRYLQRVKGVRNVAVVGHSAGAVSAILSAARNPDIGAVVAVAPFTCVSDVWFTNRPKVMPAFVMDWTLWAIERMRGFRRDDVCPLRVVEQIAPRPLLLIHGMDDSRITLDQVSSLFSVADSPKSLWLVDGASHSGIRSPVLDQLAPDVIAFLDAAWQDRAITTAESGGGASRETHLF